MEPVVIDIAGTAGRFMKWVARQLLVLVGVIVVGLSAPLLFTVGALWLAWRYPDSASTWAVVYLFVGPFACAIWMVFICHFHSIRQWQRAGKLDRWREDHGGIYCTVGKSIWFMVAGFFGSVLAEGALIYAANRLSVIPGHLMLFFAVAPFAVFAPLVLVLLSRWIHGDEYRTTDG